MAGGPKIFVTNMDFESMTISVADMNDLQFSPLLSEDIHSNDVKFESVDQKLYWVHWVNSNSPGKVYKSNVDGTNKTLVFTTRYSGK